MLPDRYYLTDESSGDEDDGDDANVGANVGVGGARRSGADVGAGVGAARSDVRKSQVRDVDEYCRRHMRDRPSDRWRARRQNMWQNAL